MIWATDLRETTHKSGGGKGQPSVTTHAYSASFAVALSSRVAGGVGRIWADGNLLRGSAGDFKTELGAFRFHDGGEDQAVDPLIAAALGAGVTPAHRGVAYAVFEDLALGDYGNRIPSLTFELLADDGVSGDAIAGALAGIAGSAEAIEGYAAEGDAGGALAPLAEAHGWMLHGDASRLDGGGEVVAIDRASLTARVNGRVVVPLTQARGQAEGVPVRLSLRHYESARDYQAGVQKAARPGPGRRARTIDAPMVVSAARAKALAHDRLAAEWAGRSTLELRCGWDALTVEPGAEAIVEGIGGRWRVVEREWEAMGVRLALAGLPGGSAPVMAASPGAAVAQDDVAHGATALMLADLPVLTDDAPAAPVVVVAAAGESAGWRRAALFVREPGSGEATPAGATAARATMGVVTGAPVATSSALFDEAAAIEVELLSDAMLLTGADDAALLGGANMALVGDELIQFGRVSQTGARMFRLSRLLRGRRGTEWAIAGHVAGAPFLLLEADRLAAAPAGAVRIGGDLTMLAIGIGDATPAEASCAMTGAALTPLSPVHLRTEDDGAGGLAVRWVRRSRAGWRWLDGVDAPLGEERERYAVTVLDDARVARTAEVDMSAWTYDAAMRAADGVAGVLAIEVRQIGAHALGRAARVIVDEGE